jgi:Domain of unknown function (DUF6259)
MPTIQSGDLSFSFEASVRGPLKLTGILDTKNKHQWLTGQKTLFGAATNSGNFIKSNQSPMVDVLLQHSPRSFTVWCHLDNLIQIQLNIQGDGAKSAVRIYTRISNNGTKTVFLRLFLPLILICDLKAPSPNDALMACVPRELGSVRSLAEAPPIGMRFNRKVGLPTSMNMMEVASVYDASGGGGVFFADTSGNRRFQRAPLQFTLSGKEVVGFWICDIQPGTSIEGPSLGIGVHSTGDWHNAIDYYLAAHQWHTHFADTPPWLREAGGIYSFGGGGAGSIYLQYRGTRLDHGSALCTYERDQGPWRDGLGDQGRERFPIQISSAGFAPAGSPVIAAQQMQNQTCVFAVGDDGGVWVTWQRGGGAWRDGKKGRVPARVTPASVAPPGAPLAAAHQNERQLDVFWVHHDGSIWVTWAVDDGQWRDGQDGRDPARITPMGYASPTACLAAIKQNSSQLDVFWVRDDGAVWVTWIVNEDGRWRDGGSGKLPARITPPNVAPAGAPLAAIKPRDNALYVFYVGDDGAIWLTYEVDDGPWTDGKDGRHPLRVSPRGKFPYRAHIAAAKRHDGQLQVFAVGLDGAIWMTWPDAQGKWRDGDSGRLPTQVTPQCMAPAGAHLVAVHQTANQLDVFVVGKEDRVWLTCERPDGSWPDGREGRPEPLFITPGGFAPAGAGVAALLRPDGQMEAYAVSQGRITSFRQLPTLLKEATELGTNVLYLWDYWEGSDAGGMPHYWNKGDYVPRGDLGGKDALIEGIVAIHAQGGRVIAYLEPFIIYKYSEIASGKAAKWTGMQDGAPFSPYIDNDTMVAPFLPWQEEVVGIAQRLVKDYGIDGIFLDSWAWQMNQRLSVAKEGIIYSPAQWNEGVLTLTEKVRTAIRSIKADAVVLGETTAGPIAFTWDGGLAADFFNRVKKDPDFPWNEFREMNENRLLASPVRYGFPEVLFFSNGHDLNELHQVYAAGHSLALCSHWCDASMHDDALHIKQLLDVRRELRDAMVYGKQVYQPRTSEPSVAAYYFRGNRKEVITIVNTDEADHDISLEMMASERDSMWRDRLNGPFYWASGTTMSVSMPRASVRVLARRNWLLGRSLARPLSFLNGLLDTIAGIGARRTHPNP